MEGDLELRLNSTARQTPPVTQEDAFAWEDLDLMMPTKSFLPQSQYQDDFVPGTCMPEKAIPRFQDCLLSDLGLLADGEGEANDCTVESRQDDEGTLAVCKELCSSDQEMNEGLRSVQHSIPQQFCSIFPFEYFNAVQSNSFLAFTCDENLVVAAPTGSGKTAIFELAICRLIEKRESLPPEFKIVYLAPIKALCSEKAQEWQQKFRPLGLHVGEVTGDQDGRSDALRRLDVICTTPEKWDSITRTRWNSAQASWQPNEMDLFFQFGVAAKTALLIVDEAHNLHEQRGATMEAVVSRMRMTQTLLRIANSSRAAATSLRVIVASATVPNLEDFQDWIRPAQARSFDESVRPSVLTTHVLGYYEGNAFLFEQRLNQRLPEVLKIYSNGRPCLVFCPSRKSSLNTALFLMEFYGSANRDGGQGATGPLMRHLQPNQRRRVEQAATACNDRNLRQMLTNGVAFHNASLESVDRFLVEDLFRSGLILVLCTTTTLAQGVNLPAHLVVVKSTKVYRNGALVEYDANAVVQMCGRAGRPQFDEFGTAVIMTRKESVSRYEMVVKGAHEAVESQLHDSLVEHINAEHTYYWVRLKRNPRYYKVSPDLSPDEIEQKLKEICVKQINILAEEGFITCEDDGMTIAPAAPGLIMARSNLTFETMKSLRQCFQSTTAQEILGVVVHAKEFRDVKLRRAEKRDLNEMNKLNPYQLEKKARVHTGPNKVFVLVLSYLSDSEPLIKLPALRLEATQIVQLCNRIVRCTVDYMVAGRRKVTFTALKAGFHLRRCLITKTSPDGSNILKQLKGIGDVTNKLLQNVGVRTFDQLEALHPRRIEALLSKNAPFGNDLLDRLGDIPKPTLELSWQRESVLTAHVRVDSQRQDHFRMGDKQALFLLLGLRDEAWQYCHRFSIAAGVIFDHVIDMKDMPNKHKSIDILLGVEDFSGVDVCGVFPPGLQACHQNLPKSITIDWNPQMKKTLAIVEALRKKAEAIPSMPVKRIRDSQHGTINHCDPTWQKTSFTEEIAKRKRLPRMRPALPTRVEAATSSQVPSQTQLPDDPSREAESSEYASILFSLFSK